MEYTEQRELLKLAAKACGISNYLSIYIDGTHLLDADGTEWNPFYDVNDLLKLIGLLDIEIFNGMVVVDTDKNYIRMHYNDPNDLCDTIIRVAAEIGRGNV